MSLKVLDLDFCQLERSELPEIVRGGRSWNASWDAGYAADYATSKVVWVDRSKGKGGVGGSISSAVGAGIAAGISVGGTTFASVSVNIGVSA